MHSFFSLLCPFFLPNIIPTFNHRYNFYFLFSIFIFSFPFYLHFVLVSYRIILLILIRFLIGFTLHFIFFNLSLLILFYPFFPPPQCLFIFLVYILFVLHLFPHFSFTLWVFLFSLLSSKGDFLLSVLFPPAHFPATIRCLRSAMFSNSLFY